MRLGGGGISPADLAEDVIEAALPFLRRQWEDGHPVLAVIERARRDRFQVRIVPGYPGVGISLYDGDTLARSYGELLMGRSQAEGSLDECARALLANWPEKT
jgi:hypothetical protein